MPEWQTIGHCWAFVDPKPSSQAGIFSACLGRGRCQIRRRYISGQSGPAALLVEIFWEGPSQEKVEGEAVVGGVGSW